MSLCTAYLVFMIFLSEKTWCYLLYSHRTTVIVFQKFFLLICLEQYLYKIVIFCFPGVLFGFLLLITLFKLLWCLYGLMHVLLYSIGTQYHLSSDMEVQLLKFTELWKRYECHLMVAHLASYIFRFCLGKFPRGNLVARHDFTVRCRFHLMRIKNEMLNQ